MKILYVATVVKKHIMEFHIPYLKMMKELGWETAVAAKNDYEDPSDCIIPYCDTYYDIPFARSPLKLKNVKAFFELKKVFEEGEYDIIHCHTPVGALLTRLAAKETRKKGTKIIYTAHGFHFYKGAPLINWLVYYPVERFLAYQTDILITINKEDYNTAKHFKAGKVVYVPGVGIDIEKFNQKECQPEIKRMELGINPDAFVLLSVGELIPRKNHEIVIDALGILKRTGSLSNIQYCVCGSGNLLPKLKEKVEKLGLQNHVHFLGYRHDISEIMKCSDLFIFMSLQEGLPVALMEAMSCGLPSICSDIRGNTDLIEDQKNGSIVRNDSSEIASEIVKLRNDVKLRNKYSYMSKHTIKHYDLCKIEPEIRKYYLEEACAIAGSSIMGGRVGGVGINSLLRACYTCEAKTKQRIPLSATVILSVGEVNKNKNHRIIIEALPSFSNCYFVLCGQGPLMEKLKKKAEHLGVGERFIMTGYRKDVAEFYRMADIFVFPSLREGLPVALMEAMSSDLPCVAAKNRGTNDLLPNSKLRFRATDSVDFKLRLQLALNHECIEEITNNKKHLQLFKDDTVLETVKEMYLDCKSIKEG